MSANRSLIKEESSCRRVWSEEHQEMIVFHEEEMGRDSKMNFFLTTSDKEKERRNYNMINGDH